MAQIFQSSNGAVELASLAKVIDGITFESVRRWSIEQVSIWLQENNFKEHQKLFAELDHEVLKELKIRSIGDRIRLIAAVRNLLKICAGNNYSTVKYPKDTNSSENEKIKSTLSRSNSNSRVLKCIKVYGEEGQTRTIPINSITDAKSILARILQKFNINEDAEKYSLFATLSDARSLSDEEIVDICTCVTRPERERLTLRKKHLPMSHEQKKEQLRSKKLENFFGEQPPRAQPTGIAGISHRKLRNFFGQRPPSELISSNLTDYFPGHATEDLEQPQEGCLLLLELQGQDLDGSFGSVYLGLNSATGELMAVKQVELPTGNSANEERKKSMVDALQREIALLKELQHENIVQYLGCQRDDETLNIFLEYVPGGSVTTILNNYGALEEPLVRSFVRQILQGLEYLHGKDIIHRDIKGANVLVDNKGRIKISDFGISKKVEDRK
ncbi:10194_t:CDS:10 [Racocetra fulgida]|uniref:mitogen-activated protein kinase kinase kinase n=1 Tax=Racocetra fulgida TaxID=60492 RepID=A0A9N8WQ77_9GLOM|nr:10194_t:CDS:10 [Racocetra fulgida]